MHTVVEYRIIKDKYLAAKLTIIFMWALPCLHQLSTGEQWCCNSLQHRALGNREFWVLLPTLQTQFASRVHCPGKVTPGIAPVTVKVLNPWPSCQLSCPSEGLDLSKPRLQSPRNRCSGMWCGLRCHGWGALGLAHKEKGSHLRETRSRPKAWAATKQETSGQQLESSTQVL